MIDQIHTTSSISQHRAIGVLTDTELLLVDVVQGKRTLRSLLLPLDMGKLSGLLEQLWETGLSEAWVMPDTTLSRRATCAWLEQAGSHWHVVVHPDPREPACPISALFWPSNSRQEARRIALAFPEYAGWDWELADARSLLATVTYLEQLLARPLVDAPELVAHQLLTDLALAPSGSWLHSSPPDWRPLPGNSDGITVPAIEGAHELAWMRPLTRREQYQRYLHKYSHLSLCLEACLSVQLGTGTAQYSSHGRACDGIHPGIWRVKADPAGSVFDGKGLPSCLAGERMSTPEVRCCQTIGYQVQVQEGYYWQESQALLKRWATTLWQVAERLHTQPQRYRHSQGRANAAHTIKQLAELGVTMLARERAKGGLARPDWWVQIVGGSRAALFGHLVNLVRQGTMPVLVHKDAFWVVSNDPNPLTAVPGLLTAHRWKGYTAGYEVPLPLSREVRAILGAAEHAGQAARALDSLANDAFA